VVHQEQQDLVVHLEPQEVAEYQEHLDLVEHQELVEVQEHQVLADHRDLLDLQVQAVQLQEEQYIISTMKHQLLHIYYYPENLVNYQKIL